MTHHPKAIYCTTQECLESHDPACTHDPLCSGFGWAHDAQLTKEQRENLGLPPFGEISYRKALRYMRAYRKQLREELEWN